ncbi:MAG: nitroreductase family deazaflavin-dependent oxidoreductase [Acidimicrobiia bacterium]|nr:nitroreductase family deazaflavin-dependent oxidoreductase [Acidimicrobiia bacterium]MDH3396969.1 nitroreductase family deazaflavin-dependent oxidoreductase [Acidimicrobiia bacterium]
MATEDPSPTGGGSSHLRYADELRKMFRLLNGFMIALWRLGLGGMLNAWPSVGGRLMVLVHRGRRSGREYRTPLNYAVVDDHVYCLAGFGEAADWYRNALAAPEVEVWLPDGWWGAKAVDVSEVPERTDLMRAVMIGSGFAAYVAGIDPRRWSDAHLDEKSRDYRLLRLERTVPRTGTGGPGDLAWTWPWATALFLAALLRQWQRAE